MCKLRKEKDQMHNKKGKGSKDTDQRKTETVGTKREQDNDLE